MGEQSWIEPLLRGAAGVAFPAAIAVYLLTRMEAAIKDLSNKIASLERTLALMGRRDDDHYRGE